MTTIRSKSALISWIFSKLNEVKQIVHDFWLSFTINNKQIEPNLNSVFVNKYDKIRWGPRYFDYFWEFLNSSISLLRIFVYNLSIQKNVICFCFLVLLTSIVIKANFDFFRVRSIRSVNQIQKMNGKKALFAVT
jgi:hypothetical protein